MSFSTLDPDIRVYFAKQNPEICITLSLTNREINSFFKNLLFNTNNNIKNSFPLLTSRVSFTNIDSTLLFKKLMNNLHDEAERLSCDQLSALSMVSKNSERMSWEYSHCTSLIQSLQIKMEQYKQEDFDKFVKAVAKKIGISLLPETNRREFWETVLKNDIRLKEIENIGMIKKNMRFIPPELGLLLNLKEIHFNDNKLNSFPSEASLLTQLTFIGLRNNNYKVIPSDFRHYTKLKYLDFTKNKLTELPTQWNIYSQLMYLRLDCNQITEIPSELSALMLSGINPVRSRININLNNNPLKSGIKQ